jgi:hypothetical protein
LEDLALAGGQPFEQAPPVGGSVDGRACEWVRGNFPGRNHFIVNATFQSRLGLLGSGFGLLGSGFSLSGSGFGLFGSGLCQFGPVFSLLGACFRGFRPGFGLFGTGLRLISARLGLLKPSVHGGSVRKLVITIPIHKLYS